MSEVPRRTPSSVTRIQGSVPTPAKNFNPFLAQVKPFPTDKEGQYASLYLNGRLGKNLEDVRTTKNRDEFFSPRPCHLSAAEAIIEAVRKSYENRNPAETRFAEHINRQNIALRSRSVEAFPVAMVPGQCIIVSGPLGIGKGAFRQRIRDYLGMEVVPHRNLSDAIAFTKQLKYLEIPFPSSGKPEHLIYSMLHGIDSEVKGVIWDGIQKPTSRTGLLTPQLFAHAGRVGLGLLYVYGIDAQKLSARSAMDCLKLLEEFSVVTGVPVVCSATCAIWALLDGTIASTLKLASGGIHRFEYIALGSDWGNLVNAFLRRFRLTVADIESSSIRSFQDQVPLLLKSGMKDGADAQRSQGDWFATALIVEAVGLPMLLFVILEELWKIMKIKARNQTIIEKNDFIRASKQYRTKWEGLRANLSILLGKERCSREETMRLSDWILPEQRAHGI
ncbi:hypothetical protein E5S69_14615 [Cupriavidus necator]|uniref:hypothetical protein n=1 Tax=Cupriavidus necator TaxID=106590 RepID=UPI00148F617F|nr:hypothetical protein [Cupriavidus necator]NOV24740.1 hypothetical protein [Cupriavidus necator]